MFVFLFLAFLFGHERVQSQSRFTNITIVNASLRLSRSPMLVVYVGGMLDTRLNRDMVRLRRDTQQCNPDAVDLVPNQRRNTIDIFTQPLTRSFRAKGSYFSANMTQFRSGVYIACYYHSQRAAWTRIRSRRWTNLTIVGIPQRIQRPRITTISRGLKILLNITGFGLDETVDSAYLMTTPRSRCVLRSADILLTKVLSPKLCNGACLWTQWSTNQATLNYPFSVCYVPFRGQPIRLGNITVIQRRKSRTLSAEQMKGTPTKTKFFFKSKTGSAEKAVAVTNSVSPEKLSRSSTKSLPGPKKKRTKTVTIRGWRTIDATVEERTPTNTKQRTKTKTFLKKKTKTISLPRIRTKTPTVVIPRPKTKTPTIVIPTTAPPTPPPTNATTNPPATTVAPTPVPSPTPAPTLNPVKMMIPFYADPTNDAQWKQVIDAAKNISFIIVNVSLGAYSSAMADRINSVRKVGIGVLDIVATDRGNRPQKDVLAEIASARNSYNISGFYLNETDPSLQNSTINQIFQTYSTTVRSNKSSSYLVMSSVGVPQSSSYLQLADTIVISEGSYDDSAPAPVPSWLATAPPTSAAWILTGVKSADAMKSAVKKASQSNVGYQMVSDVSFGNWAASPLPLYFADEAKEVGSAGIIITPPPTPAPTREPVDFFLPVYLDAKDTNWDTVLKLQSNAFGYVLVRPVGNDTGLADRINKLRSSNIQVLATIATNYGQRNETDVINEMTLEKKIYNISGFFLNETSMNTTITKALYTKYTTTIQSLFAPTSTPVIAMSPASQEAYDVSDIVVIEESQYNGTTSVRVPNFVGKTGTKKYFAWMVTNCPDVAGMQKTVRAAAENKVTYLVVTNERYNTWTTIPTYASQEAVEFGALQPTVAPTTAAPTTKPPTPAPPANTTKPPTNTTNRTTVAPNVTATSTPLPTGTQVPKPTRVILLWFTEFSDANVLLYQNVIASVGGVADPSRLVWDKTEGDDPKINKKQIGTKIVIKLTVKNTTDPYAINTDDIIQGLLNASTNAALSGFTSLRNIGLVNITLLMDDISIANEADTSSLSTGWLILIAFGFLNVALFIGIWMKKRASTGEMKSLDEVENEQRGEDDEQGLAQRLLANIRKDEKEEGLDREMIDLEDKFDFYTEQSQQIRRNLEEPETKKKLLEAEMRLPNLQKKLEGNQEFQLPKRREGKDPQPTTTEEGATRSVQSPTNEDRKPLLRPHTLEHPVPYVKPAESPEVQVANTKRMLQDDANFKLPGKRSEHADLL